MLYLQPTKFQVRRYGDCSRHKTIVEKYGGDDTFVIGGGEVYKQLLPYCDSAYITKVFSDGNADVFIDNLDENEMWNWVMCPKNTLKTAFLLHFTLI